MVEEYIKNYVRLLDSVSLTQADKERITEQLIERSSSKKEISKKYVAVASVAVVLAAGTIIAIRRQKKI